MPRTHRTFCAPRSRAEGIALLVAALVAAILGAAPPALAQTRTIDAKQSYITPYPAREPYRLTVIGDQFADGLAGALSELLASEPRLRIERKPRIMPPLVRADFETVAKTMADAAQKEPAEIIVVMQGFSDRQTIRLANGRRANLGSDEWKTEYARRIDEVMKTLKRQDAAIYWLSQPIFRRAEWNDDAEAVNAVLREQAYINGIRYIDVYRTFTDEDGNFTPYGPDMTGTSRLLRERDGFSFTEIGYQMLGHLVEREVRRDLAQALAERNLPLAGSEAEQARINPERAQLAIRQAEAARRTTAAASAAPPVTPRAAAKAAAAAAGLTDQKAETARVSFKAKGAGGREEVVSVDIVRPAIPAQVLAALARDASDDRPTLLGDAITTVLESGIVVTQSVAPSGDSAAARPGSLLSTQTPYFKVWTKGERLLPLPGRIDDFSWQSAPAQGGLVPAALVPSASAGPAGTDGGRSNPPAAAPLPPGRR